MMKDIVMFRPLVFQENRYAEALEYQKQNKGSFLCRLVDIVGDHKKTVGWYVWRSKAK